MLQVSISISHLIGNTALAINQFPSQTNLRASSIALLPPCLALKLRTEVVYEPYLVHTVVAE